MDPQLMVRTAVVLLAITGAGGLLMAGIRFSGRPHPPTWFAMVHGLLAGSGLTLLLYAGFTAGLADMAWAGVALLAVAALGGVLLNLRYHWKHQALPVSIVLVHAGVAVAGLVVLAIPAWA